MDLTQFFEILWRQKIVVLAFIAAGIGAAALAAYKLITPTYQATSTVALRPANLQEDLVFFQTIDALISIYANAAVSPDLRAEAADRAGGSLGEISIETFEGTPLLKIEARDSDPEVAEQSAQAVTDVLVAEVSSGSLGVPSLRMIQIERPSLPTSPVFPKKTLSLAIGGLVGLILGVLSALLRENVTGRVRTPEELAGIVDAPCFAEIPNVSAVSRLFLPEALVKDSRLRGVSESMRDLRTNLLFSNDQLRSILVTSPDGHHGKTTVAVGLAVTLAVAGTRTLLLDGDVRRGRVAEAVKVTHAPGLSDALRGDPVEIMIQRTSLENLFVVPRGSIWNLSTAGSVVHDPSELMMARFATILRQLEGSYEAVVIDSPPVTAVNDARIMASSAASTILVISADTATRRRIRAAVERLSMLSIRPTAVVLNRSKGMRAAGYYGTTEPNRVLTLRGK